MVAARRSKRRWLTYVTLIGAIALVTVVTTMIVVAVRFEPAGLAALVSTKIKQRTGRELTIEGPIVYSWWWVPTISAERVRFQNASWGSRPDMISVRRIEVEIALLPLFRGEVRIRGLVLIEPDVLLEVDRKGRGNWRFDPPHADAAATETSADNRADAPDIAYARVEQGVIAYRNAASGRELRLAVAQLELDGGSASTTIEGKGTFNSVPVEISAKLPGAWASGMSTAKSELTLTGADVRLHAQGVLPLALERPNANFAFSAEVSDWSAVAKLMQMHFRKLPPLKAQGTLRWDAEWLVLENLQASMGKSHASGHVRIGGSDAERTLDARLDAPLLDLSELLGPDTNEPSNDGRLFSAEAFPLGVFAGITGKAQARIGRLALRDGKSFDGAQLVATFDRGKIDIDPARLDVEGKKLLIKAHADARNGKTLKLDLALDGHGISLGALGALLDITGTPQGAPTDISLRMIANGNSIRNLMASASGELRVVVGPGRLRNRVVNFGADVTELIKLLNPAYAADPYTELKCAVIRLPVRQGVAHVANSIAMETSKVDIIAAGTIDLRNETLDLGFRTKAATGLGVGLGTLAELGRLRGTLANPDVEVDLGGAARTAAHIGLAAITGGLSLIASGLLMQSVPDNPCKVALSGGTSARSASASAPSVVDKVLGNIKQLFGR